jgi:hypothetical protein
VCIKLVRIIDDVPGEASFVVVAARCQNKRCPLVDGKEQSKRLRPRVSEQQELLMAVVVVDSKVELFGEAGHCIGSSTTNPVCYNDE